jgi:hypothetical protein
MTKIELKNIKYAAFASEETNCYKATLYVNGKRFAYLSNDGHGGCDRQEPIEPYTYKDLAQLEKTIAKEYPKWGSEFHDGVEYDMTLEIVCGNLINEWHIDKEIKRTLKKITFIKSIDDKEIIYTDGNVAQAKKLGDQIRRKILQDYPKAIILNDLPIDEARTYFQ